MGCLSERQLNFTHCVMLSCSEKWKIFPMNYQTHFVTGKGGVGKSAYAAALALSLSQKSRRVLLIELGDRSFYQDYLGLSHIGYTPVSFKKNLDVALWSSESSLREYAKYLLKVDKIAELFFDNPVMRSLVDIAPALQELAILGKITSGPRKHGPTLAYDDLVIDAYSTGHFLALLNAPKGMSEAITLGPMGEQSRSIQNVLFDSKLTNYSIITLPEELPIQESKELYNELNKQYGINAKIVLNKVLQVDNSNDELKKIISSNSSFSSFASYILKTKYKAEEAQSIIKAITKNHTLLPLVLDDSPAEVISLLAQNISKEPQ